jgi:hypothetical protein
VNVTPIETHVVQAPRRRLLLPAPHKIGPIRLCLPLDLQLRGIVHRRIVADRDVGHPPGARLVGAEHRILKWRSGGLDRDDRLDRY